MRDPRSRKKNQILDDKRGEDSFLSLKLSCFFFIEKKIKTLRNMKRRKSSRFPSYRAEMKKKKKIACLRERRKLQEMRERQPL